MKDSQTRRGFITKAGAVGSAAALTSLAGGAQAAQNSQDRRVIPGSRTLSRAVVVGNIAYVSGNLGRGPDGIDPDFETQARRAMENLKASVEAAGSTMAQVVKCTCFLTDRSDFAIFNRVYSSFFTSQPPARSTVVVKDLVEGTEFLW